MNDTVNSDGNLFGRLVALVLIAAVAFGAYRLACGGSCFLKSFCCPSAASAPFPEAVKSEPAVPAEKPKRRVHKPVEKPLPAAVDASTAPAASAP